MLRLWESRLGCGWDGMGFEMVVEAGECGLTHLAVVTEHGVEPC